MRVSDAGRSQSLNCVTGTISAGEVWCDIRKIVITTLNWRNCYRIADHNHVCRLATARSQAAGIRAWLWKDLVSREVSANIVALDLNPE